MRGGGARRVIGSKRERNEEQDECEAGVEPENFTPAAGEISNSVKTMPIPRWARKRNRIADSVIDRGPEAGGDRRSIFRKAKALRHRTNGRSCFLALAPDG